MAVDRLRLVQRGPPGGSVQQLRLPHPGAGVEEALFLGRVFAQHLDGVLQSGQIAPGLRQGRGVPVQQGGVSIPGQSFLLRLADFHTAHMKQLRQQGVPILGQGDELEPFHLDNSHLVSNHPS